MTAETESNIGAGSKHPQNNPHTQTNTHSQVLTSVKIYYHITLFIARNNAQNIAKRYFCCGNAHSINEREVQF